MRVRFVLAALAGSLALLSGPGNASGDDPYRTAEPLNWSLPQLHGPSVQLSSLRGQWVVLNYWATWCAPCRKEIPELSELHRTRDDVTVLGLAFEEAEPADFEAFLSEFDAAYPILLVDVYSPPKPFGAPRVLPTSIVVNPRGYAIKGFPGPVTRADLEAFIEEAGEP